MENDLNFCCYSRTDGDFVLKLAKDLRSGGANVWIDQLNIKAGKRWDTAVEAALTAAKCLIVFLSPESATSNNVLDEIAFALDENKIIIPVVIRDCVVPFRIRRFQRITFKEDYQDSLASLLTALQPDSDVKILNDRKKQRRQCPGSG
jgi:hypothetical protein